jgi:hypothetical protein
MLTSTGAHYPVATGTASFGVNSRRMTKPMLKFSCEMNIVAKAAGVRNLAERLTCMERRPAIQKVRGMIQTNRIYQFAARRAARR